MNGKQFWQLFFIIGLYLKLFRNPPLIYALYYDYWKKYLDSTGPLGVLGNAYLSVLTFPPLIFFSGPLGPMGPLSSWGPIGNNSWNPSSLTSQGLFVWCDAESKHLFPCGDEIVLGPEGPLGKSKIPLLLMAECLLILFRRIWSFDAIPNLQGNV